MNPLVSVIIPVFNKEKYLSKTLESLSKQFYKHFEVILINDASTDNSYLVLKKWVSSNQNAILISLDQNKGGNHCRNIGIRNAKGDYTIFLDADDILTPECIYQRILAINQSDYDLLISNMGVFKQRIGDVHERNYWIVSKSDFLKDFLRHSLPWTIMQPTWKTEILKSSSGFDTSMKRLQDVEFHTRLLITGLKIKIQPNKKPDCFYRIANDRHHFNKQELLEKLVNSAKTYIDRFKDISPEFERDLMGTSLEITSSILHCLKMKEISRKQAKNLFCSLKEVHKTQWTLSSYYYIQAKLPFRVPGFKKFFHLVLHGL